MSHQNTLKNKVALVTGGGKNEDRNILGNWMGNQKTPICYQSSLDFECIQFMLLLIWHLIRVQTTNGVTGSGIGRSISLALAHEGVSIVVADIKETG